jgi:hypothetical protein
MKAIKIIVLVLVLVPAVAVLAIFVRNKAVGPVGWAQDDAERMLGGYMKDPESMVIRSSFVVQRTTAHGYIEISVCGIVDGRNSFGAYTGGQRFASLSTHSSSLKTFDTRSVEIEDVEQKRVAASLGMLSAFEKVYCNSRCVDGLHPELVPEATVRPNKSLERTRGR